MLSVNELVSDQARCLTEAAPALRAAVRASVGVDGQLVPPEVWNLFESLPAIGTRFGLGWIDGHFRDGGCSQTGLRGGGWVSGLRGRRVPVVFQLSLLCMSLEEGLRGEGQLTAGAQEDLRRR